MIWTAIKGFFTGGSGLTTYLILGLLIAAGGYVGFTQVQLANRATEIATLTGDKKDLEGKLQAAKDSISAAKVANDAQNAAIAALQVHEARALEAQKATYEGQSRDCTATIETVRQVHVSVVKANATATAYDNPYLIGLNRLRAYPDDSGPGGAH